MNLRKVANIELGGLAAAAAWFIAFFAATVTIVTFAARVYEKKGLSAERPVEDLMIYGLLISFIFVILYLAARSKAQQRYRIEIELGINELRKKLKNYSLVFSDIHKVLHGSKNTIAEIIEENDYYALGPVISNFLRDFLNIYREILTKVTGEHDISTCIKVFTNYPDEILRTVARDSNSIAARGQNDAVEEFRVDKNSDFIDLYKLRKKYFVANNLEELEKQGDYINERQDWKNRYRSTAVFPIRRMRGHECDFAGFLCADSQRVDIFEPDVMVAIGSAMVDVLYPVLIGSRILDEYGEGDL